MLPQQDRLQLPALEGGVHGLSDARKIRHPEAKPSSLVADFSKLPETVDAALRGEQLQPILLR